MEQAHAISIFLNPESLPLAPNIWSKTFHLGTGKETSIIKLANHVKSLFRDEIKIVFEPERKGEIKRNYSDIGKAKEVLGFPPEISLDDRIKQVYKWFMNKDIAEIKKG